MNRVLINGVPVTLASWFVDIPRTEWERVEGALPPEVWDLVKLKLEHAEFTVPVTEDLALPVVFFGDPRRDAAANRVLRFVIGINVLDRTVVTYYRTKTNAMVALTILDELPKLSGALRLEHYLAADNLVRGLMVTQLIWGTANASSFLQSVRTYAVSLVYHLGNEAACPFCTDPACPVNVAIGAVLHT